MATDKQKLPIDIQYRKLLEALIDRKIVPQKWVEQQRPIRDAIAVLFADVPRTSDKLVKFCKKKGSHEDLHYFDCRYIFECLKQTDDGAAKNFFGQYTSPVMKKWDALIRQYEKSNVFAAEAARIITQNTAYEIPLLKKAIQQNEKQVADNNRKIADLTKSIAEYKRKLELSCSTIGIQGVSFREELQRLPLELPSIFNEIGRAICSDDLAAALAYHRALQEYLHSCEPPSVSVATTASSTASLSSSTTSSSSSKKDKKKKSAKATAVVTAAPEEPVNAAFATVATPFAFFAAIDELCAASDVVAPPPSAIDFEADAAEINWDFSIDDSGDAADGGIDWGIESVSDDTAVAGASAAASDNNDGDAPPIEIDWDISLDDIADSVDVSLSVDDATAAAAAAMTTETLYASTAATTDAPTRVALLADSDFRTRVQNDLLELRTFLRQRRDELQSSNNVAFANQFQGTSAELEQQSVETVEMYERVVERVLSQLTDKRLQQLILIQTSPRYLDRHVASLEMLTTQMGKCRREIETLEDKNIDLIDATGKIQPQIDACVNTTRKLKRELELALPALFKGYRVNIVGDVNNL